MPRLPDGATLLAAASAPSLPPQAQVPGGRQRCPSAGGAAIDGLTCG